MAGCVRPFCFSPASIPPKTARERGRRLRGRGWGARERRLALVDPRRVLDRGYAILRTEGDGVLTDAGDAPAGSVLSAELRRGALRLRSEGKMEREGS